MGFGREAGQFFWGQYMRLCWNFSTCKPTAGLCSRSQLRVTRNRGPDILLAGFL